MSSKREAIKKQILSALGHAEAEEGLYFNNLIATHEDEERTAVTGSEEEILEALQELISEGSVKADESQEQVIFLLAR